MGFIMDRLSDILSSLHVGRIEMIHLDLSGQWVLRREPLPNQIAFCTVMRGPCWLVPALSGSPLQLETGDCVVVAKDGTAASLTSGLEAAAMPSILPAHPPNKTVVRIVTGSDTRLLGARFSFGEASHPMIRKLLPDMIHVKATSEQAAPVREALENLASELQNERMGRALMVDALAQKALLAALRAHSAETEYPFARSPGALADPRIGTALMLMHDDVARHWTVADLAEAVGMTRSRFAARFKTLVDMTPLDYLLQWRMHLADRRIRTGHDPLASVASAVGYSSASAFSTAFKRIHGHAPSLSRSHKPVANDNRVPGRSNPERLH